MAQEISLLTLEMGLLTLGLFTQSNNKLMVKSL